VPRARCVYTPKMSKEGKHHYIPIFYLKQWAGDDGRIYEFSKPYDRVKPRHVHPDATGFVHGLYTVPGLPPDQAQYVEKQYMQETDDWAAKVLQLFMHPGGPAVMDLDARGKITWARFLYSLTIRTPEHLERLCGMIPQGVASSLERFREHYDAFREPHDPPTFEGFKVRFASNPRNVAPQIVLPELLNSKLVIAEIATYRFFTLTNKNSSHAFLTSDRPIIMTNGLNAPNAHVAIPISPTRFFIAAKSNETYNEIRAMTSDQLVRTSNDKVAQQARRYVYGRDASQLRFIQNRFGRMIASTPLG